MIVAVLGEKGGTGKTTFATNLAGLAAAVGRHVLLVDADRQGSASYWAEARGAEPVAPVVAVQKFGPSLSRTVRDMAGRFDDVVIDVAAGDSREVEAALRVAGRAVVPVQPAGLDVWTLGVIDARVGEARGANPALDALVVLNRASTNPRDADVDEAKDAIRACAALGLAEAVVRERVAVKRAAPKGLTVNEYRPLDAKAAEEFNAVFALAFADLKQARLAG